MSAFYPFAYLAQRPRRLVRTSLLLALLANTGYVARAQNESLSIGTAGRSPVATPVPAGTVTYHAELGGPPHLPPLVDPDSTAANPTALRRQVADLRREVATLQRIVSELLLDHAALQETRQQLNLLLSQQAALGQRRPGAVWPAGQAAGW